MRALLNWVETGRLRPRIAKNDLVKQSLRSETSIS